MQKNLTIKDYINKLSSKDAVPGGGSAAALGASISSALTSMVFNLTVGKKAFEDYSEEEKEMIYNVSEKIKTYNEELLEMMDKDGEAFQSVMDAFKLPKETEEQKQIRKNYIDKGYKNALEAPLNLANKCMELYECVFIAAKYGNKNVISDAGVGAIFLNAAIESAILNVNINLSGIKDEKYKKCVGNEIKKLLNNAANRKIEIMDMVERKMK